MSIDIVGINSILVMLNMNNNVFMPIDTVLPVAGVRQLIWRKRALFVSVLCKSGEARKCN